jgi:DNA-binding NarL/FixJ family response regulator
VTIDVRADDLELLRAAAARLRRESGIPLVFGGLRDERGVPVTLTMGEVTNDLATITIKPSLGLGGKTILTRRPAYVRDYGTSLDITHEYDRQILGERVTFLAVVPIVVRDDLRGLLYAGTRDTPLSSGALDSLVTEARKVSDEMEIRDEVDRRVRLADSIASAGPETAELQRLREAFAQMRVIARETDDLRTREQLEALLNRTSDAPVALTTRQLDVVSLAALGCRNAEIAARLGLGQETVKSYLRSAMARLGASSRHEAVAAARRHGLLP